MQINTLKTAVLCILATAVVVTPLLSCADDVSTNAPVSADKAASATSKKKGTSFSGDLTGVDTNAMTLTVTNLTLTVTSDTVIKKGSKLATLADAVALIGKHTTGTYKKGDDGKLVALTVHLNSTAGRKSGTKKKKEAATDPAPTN
jgi:hypothetical protein